MFKAAIEAHQNQAAVFKFDVDRPTAYSDKLVDDYHPVFIAYPEGWRNALYHSRQRVLYLLSHDLTPTEALDYWALEFGTATFDTTPDTERWRAHRGVDQEAINKSKRQAQDKMGDENHQPFYPEQDIETTQIE